MTEKTSFKVSMLQQYLERITNTLLLLYTPSKNWSTKQLHYSESCLKISIRDWVHIKLLCQVLQKSHVILKC